MIASIEWVSNKHFMKKVREIYYVIDCQYIMNTLY